MHRTFYNNTLAEESSITLTDPDELHHLTDVLRHKQGDAVRVFNGKGAEAEAELISVSKKNATIRIKKVTFRTPHKISLTLACAVPKKSKFETIIEKAVELGVSEIIPLKTERTEAAWKTEHNQKKIKRFNTVILNAVKQSQQLYIPEIRPLTKFKDALKDNTGHAAMIIPSLAGNPDNILSVLKNISITEKLIIFIGPEGDFTADEYAQAQAAGCIPVSLGPTVLKVETAALAAAACAAQVIHSHLNHA